MNARRTALRRGFAALVCAGLLAACDSGPGESEFVAACLKEGQRGINNAMGIDRDKFCKCGAKAALASVSDNGRRLLVWEMEGGKRQEIAALQSKMSDEEKMQVVKASFEVMGKCIGGG